MLSSSVVTNPRVPRLVRHSLNLESGLNDGLALAPVLALGAALAADQHDFVWWRFVLQDVGLGFAFGVAIGFAASLAAAARRLHARRDARPPARALRARHRVRDVRRSPSCRRTATASSPCSSARSCSASAAPTSAATSPQRSEDIVEIVKLGVFVVFGSLLTLDGLFTDGWAAVALVVVTLLLARPVAVWIALAGTRVDWATKAFMAWFGPKGVATMTFSLLVLGQPIPGSERIFNLAALVVVCSILAHGLTDTPGTEWIARRRARDATASPEAPSPTRSTSTPAH